MENFMRVKREGVFDYKIIWTTEFDWLASSIRELNLTARKVCIISDNNVFPLFGAKLVSSLAPIFDTVISYTIPAGEEHKNLNTIQELYGYLIRNKMDRKDLLIALGGGVIGDMTGFTAATYLRGIDFIQIPTTLLAQVDSSIGGKTGVDYDQYKNMVGAFYQPRLVYMNLSVLTSLSEELFSCGMAEVIKTSLIYDRNYFEWICNHKNDILKRDPEILASMIKRSCEIKSLVVEQDPTEKGLRAILNFGHTIGHAVEKLMDFRMLHGQCVSVGMAAAAFLSEQRGFLSSADVEWMLQTLTAFGLPIVVSGLSIQDILLATKSDKKMEQGNIKFVLLESIGESIIDPTVTDKELNAAISFIVKSND